MDAIKRVNACSYAGYGGKSLGYILHISSGQSNDYIAIAGKSSENYIELLDTRNLKCITRLNGSSGANSQTICDIKIHDENKILSCGRDGYLKIFDMRAGTQEAWSQRLSPNNTDADVNSLDISDRLVAVGVDANVMVFDIRRQTPYFKFGELHSEPVSSIRFYSNDKLASGSEDGTVALVDLLDLKNEDNGQSPEIAFNTNDGIRSILICNRRFYVFSATESLSVWSSLGALECNFFNIRHHPLLSSDGSLAYLIGIVIEDNQIEILAGSSSGRLLALDIANSDLPVKTFFEGNQHDGVIRCCLHQRNGMILTGGEDGILFGWSFKDKFEYCNRYINSKDKKDNKTRYLPY